MSHTSGSGPRHVAASVRAELGQLSWTLRQYDRERTRIQREVATAMTLPRLPGRRGQDTIWAVSVMRDEADIAPVTVGHLLDQGVDHVLVADNGSRDGTRELLEDLAARDGRVHVARDAHPAHHQSEKMTFLAHHAWRHGARWVVPFDADELYFASDCSLAERLRGSRAAVLHAWFHHMVPAQETTSLDARTEFVLDAAPSRPGKVVARAHPLLVVGPGNHTAVRVGEHERGLHIAHAIYRSPQQVARKVRQGFAAIQQGTGRWAGTHWEKGARLDEDEVAAAWENLRLGRPEPLLDYPAAGPMVRVRPLSWSTWDPDGLVPEPTS